MPSNNKMSVEQIKQLADDIRVINGFVENHGFDGSLFNVEVSPQSTNKSINHPFLWLIVSVAVCLILVLIKVFAELSGNASAGLLLVSLVFATTAVTCTHLRFNNTTVTIIVGVGLVVLIAIGFGVLTPEQAIEKAQQLAK